MKVFGAQHQKFDGVVQYYSKAQPAVGKFIDPDDSILRTVKSVSPNTTTIVRIYTGQPTVDDVAQHPNPETYGVEYATKVYAAIKDPQHCDLVESENEIVDHYNNLTEFIKRVNAFLVGFSRRAKELGFKPLGPNFSTGYPEVFVPGTDYTLWPNAWQGLVDGLRALKNSGGALSLHEYDFPTLLRLWDSSKNLGYLVGRHKAIYKSLPADLQDLPLYITEFGLDALVGGVQGGFWHNRGEDAPSFMIQQAKESWDKVYSTTPQLKGICFFLWGTTDGPHFEEYDIARTSTSVQLFTDFFSQELQATNTPPPVTPPTTGWYPKAVKRPLTQHNYWDGHNGLAPNAVCLHIAAGPMSAIYPTFNSLSGWASAHFAISKLGAVEQYVSIADSAWAEGVIKNPSWVGLQKFPNGSYINPNYHVISVEHEGQPTDVPTAAMVAARTELLVWIAQQIGLTSYIPHVNLIGHYEIDSVDRPNCPGPNFDFNLISKWANDTLNPPPPATGVTINMVQPFVMPDAIKVFATSTPYVPVKDEYFYRLAPRAYVRNNVSALINVVVLDEVGAPEIGVQVVNIRPDGKGEIAVTSGLGQVQFNLGPGAAFSAAGQGPYTVYMAESASVPVDPPYYVTGDKVLGDKVSSLGDWGGNHTEIYLQFRKMHGSVVNVVSLEESVRYPAYDAVGKGAKFNPNAALQSQARKRNLGAVLTDEFYPTWQGVKYVAQGFAQSIIYTQVGSYADSDFKLLAW